MTHARNPFLHVANGTSTTMTIEAAGIPGSRSIWADRVTLAGVDRWLGGVHLRPGQPVWRWDDEQQTMTVT